MTFSQQFEHHEISRNQKTICIIIDSFNLKHTLVVLLQKVKTHHAASTKIVAHRKGRFLNDSKFVLNSMKLRTKKSFIASYYRC